MWLYLSGRIWDTFYFFILCSVLHGEHVFLVNQYKKNYIITYYFYGRKIVLKIADN